MATALMDRPHSIQALPQTPLALPPAVIVESDTRLEPSWMLARALPILLISMGLVLLAGVAIFGRVDAPRGSVATGTAVAPSGLVSLQGATMQPAMLQVVSGRPITLRVTNRGSSQQAFSVLVMGRPYSTPMLDPGNSATLRLPALSSGSYPMSNVLPGHPDAGPQGMIMAQPLGGSGMSGM
jgi:hypothetical protein